MCEMCELIARTYDTFAIHNAQTQTECKWNIGHNDFIKYSKHSERPKS